MDDQFEARVRLGMRLMEEGRAKSRVEALRGGEPGTVSEGEAQPDKPASTSGDDPLSGRRTAVHPGDDPPAASPIGEQREESQNRNRTKWHQAYRTVFGEEPDGPLGEARIRAAMNFYDPGRSVGRRKALEAVRASEEEAAARTQEVGRVFESTLDGEEPELEGATYLPLPSEDSLTLGAALLKIGRLEAEVEELRRAVARLEAGLHRTETRLGGMTPGLRALRDGVREIRDMALKLGARVDTLAVSSSEAALSPQGGETLVSPRSGEDKSTPPSKKELRELRARMDEERGRILLEVENRLEEAEELMRRSTESRIAALESWVRRVSRYLGIGKKGGLFR